MRRIVLIPLVATLAVVASITFAPTAAAECRIDTTIGVGGGEAVGRGVRLCNKHPDPAPKPSHPDPAPGPRSSAEEDPFEGVDPELRALIEKCLAEVHDQLCWEGIVENLPVADVAREVVARLHLPDPTPQFGPDPEANQWHMLAVGYPLWLWTSGPTRLTTTASRYGLSFTLTATWESTRFEFGDGQSLTCTKTTPYSPTTVPGAPSPTCGYVYQQASPASGYTVRAHTNWRVDWAASGQSGTIDTTYSGARTVPVGELNALIVK